MAIVKFPFDHFKVSNAGEFRDRLARAGYPVPVSADLGPLRQPLSVNGRRFDNSMAVQPLEGLDAREDGSPSELTLARYEKLAAQGAAILWVEATAVVPEGRDSLQQFWLHAGSAAGFRELARTIDEAALKAGHPAPYKILQLTHSGRCSVDSSGAPAPLAAFASPYLDPVMGAPGIVSDEYLDHLQAVLGDAAALACEAGFDAVELKLCHQYLFKELLCAYTRPGKYGGTQENRFRFALGAVDEIRRRTGGRLDVVTRLNAYDGVPWPYGWGMEPNPEGAPKNVLPAGGAFADGAPAAGAGALAAGAGASPGAAVTTTGAVAVTVPSNWSGNPSPLHISEQEKSSWQGNPMLAQISDSEKSSWQGNREVPVSAPSNWPGNPSPLHISEEEKSSWQGNPMLAQISGSEKSSWQGNPGVGKLQGTAHSNWNGNLQFVPVACRTCTAEPAACVTCPVLQQIGVASNWPGNPTFTSEACRNCTVGPVACDGCSVMQEMNVGCASSSAEGPGFAVPPMPGPMRIDLTEVKELIRQLYRRGVRVVNLSTNSPRFAPAGNGYLDNFSDKALVDPFAGASALLLATKEIRREMPGDLKIVGTGLSWFGPFSANVAAGGIAEGWFDIAGFGRSVMTDNGFVPSILRGIQPDPAKACMGCDSCFRLFFAGLPTGCPMQHAAYRDLFQMALEQGRIRTDGNTIL